MKAEAMSIDFRRESLIEDTIQIVRRDARAIVAHTQTHSSRANGKNAQGNAPFTLRGWFQRMPGVAEKIDQNLQNFVAVHQNRRHGLIFAKQPNLVALVGCPVYFNFSFYHVLWIYLFLLAHHP